MAKKSSSKTKTITGINVTRTLTGIHENKPITSGTSCSIDQTSETIRNLIHDWLTEDEASDILLQFRKACIPNHQLLWSGMLRATAQQWANTHGFQTLTTSLGPLLRTDDPDCCYCQKTRKGRSNYIHGASIVFAWFISQGDLVTVLSQPPPQRFHPTGQSFYQLYEEPIIKGMLGNRPVTKIVVAHPTIQSALDFIYEMWPHDELSLWTNSFGVQDILIHWRQVKTIKKATQLSATARTSVSSALTVQSDVVKSCGSLATSDSKDLNNSESLVTSETDNMKSVGGSPSTIGKAIKDDGKHETPNELKHTIRKPKTIKKKKKSKDKSLSTSETTNALRKMTIDKLLRDNKSESLQLLIDAAYGLIEIEIEVGESMEEKKERKKMEKEDRKMVKRMKHGIEKKQKEEMGERINGTKGATTDISEEDGPAQNTRSKAKAKKELKKLENKEDKEAISEIKAKKKEGGFLGNKL